MGSGPFTFVEHVRGSHLVGKKNPDYWERGKPYLDGFRAIFIAIPRRRWPPCAASARTSSSAASARRSATASSRRSAPRSPCRRAPGTASSWWPSTMNKKPFDDKRVRRALTLALDRYEGSKALSQIAIVKEVAGVQVPGHAVRHAAGRADQAGRLLAGHREVPRRGAPPAEGGGGRKASRSPSRIAASRCRTSRSASG